MRPAAKGIKNLYLILTVLLLIGVVPIVFTGSQLTSINSQTLEAKEKVHQVQTVRDKAEQVELYVRGYISQVASYADAFEIGGDLRRAGTAAGQEEIVQTIEQDQNLIALVFSTRNMEEDASYAFNPGKITREEVTRALRDAAQIVADRQSWIAPPDIIRSSLEPALVIAHPVMRGGDVEGVVMAVVSLQRVFRLVSQNTNDSEKKLLHGDQTIFFVVDSEGLVVAHPDQQLAFRRQDMSYLKVVQDWLDSNQQVAVTQSFNLDRDNESLPLLGSYATAQLAPGRKLGVIGVVNQKAAFLSVDLMRRRTLIVVLIAAIIATIAGLVFAHGYSSPLQTLASSAQAISGGDFTRRIEVRTASREMRQLADDFNDMTDQLQRHIMDLQELASRNKRLFLGSVRSLAAAIDGKDPYTRGHSERVMVYSEVMAELLGLPEPEVEKIRISALLHDVGKIGIEDRILRKPAALTDQEFTIMKNHPTKGAMIMSENPEMADYIPGMYMHHETLDGKGYPQGLRGEEIPLMARIVSVADCFDAMTTNRPYQRAMTFEAAIERIQTFVGTRYDDRVVGALNEAIKTARIKPDPTINNVPETQTAAPAQA